MEPPRLLARVRDRIRFKHYSIRTEEAYVDWIRRFIVFHDKRHPSELNASDVEAFLTDLAVARHVSASTQNQAKSAILFLYKGSSARPPVARWDPKRQARNSFADDPHY